MHTIIKIGRLKYLVRTPINEKPIKAKLYKANPNISFDELKSHLTPKAMLAARVKELTEYALKCTGRYRKTRLYADPRIFPRPGLCAMEYVTEYYSLNKLGTPSHFAPLARHITRPKGNDSQTNF
jgi:hypothetical protein